jgi:methionyl-tRNA synthetase
VAAVAEANGLRTRKSVGGIYQCENCGEDYTAKTVWQKFCKPCSLERRKGVLIAKAGKARGAGAP